MLRMLRALVVTAMLVAPVAQSQAQQRPAPRPAQPAPARPQPAQAAVPTPDAPTMLLLVRASLSALNQANFTNNYSVFHALGSENFQRQNPLPSVSQAFAPFRANRVSLYPALILDPQLTRNPELVQNALRLTGFFPSSQAQINFDMQFEWSQGSWKLFSLNVNLSNAQ